MKFIVTFLTMLSYGFLTMSSDCKQCIVLIPIGTLYFSFPILLINSLQFFLLFKRNYNGFIPLNFVLTILPIVLFFIFNLCISDLKSFDSKILLVGSLTNLLLNIVTFLKLNRHIKTI
jgi:hypothetical protein